MAQCLVTGSAGFLGSHVVEALVARGDRVRVLDNFSTGILSNLDNVRGEVELHLGDIDDRELLFRATEGVEVLFHFVTPRWEIDDPTDELEARWAHEAQTVRVLNAACAAKVRRVIWASSCSIYGHTDEPRLCEDDAVLPTSSHGFAKLAGEMHCLAFTSLYGLETVRLRYSNVFGPRQCPTSPYAREVPMIVKSMLIDQPVTLGRDAAVKRDLIYIDDAIHGTLLAASAPRVSGQVYNIARGRSVDLFEVAAAVNDVIGARGPGRGPKRTDTSPPAVTIDNSRAETDFGFCPSADLRQGLRSMIEYYAEQGGFPLADQVLASRKRQGPHQRKSRPASGPKPNEPESPRTL
jgi:UDP-glucose 4-epimerase